jgi:hypothetical protein
MKYIAVFLVSILCMFAADPKPTAAEIYIYWNGIVEITSPALEREFEITDSSSLIVESISSHRIQRVTIVRDKGWQSAGRDRPDLKRFDDISKELKVRSIEFSIRSASSRALPTTEE